MPAVRDVKPGDTILRAEDGARLTVATAMSRDGSDGRAVIYTSQGQRECKSKVAIELTFTNGEVVLGYPSDPVDLAY